MAFGDPNFRQFYFSPKTAALFTWVPTIDLVVISGTVITFAATSPIVLGLDTAHTGVPATDVVGQALDAYLAIMPPAVGEFTIGKTVKAGSNIYFVGNGVGSSFILTCQPVDTQTSLPTG